MRRFLLMKTRTTDAHDHAIELDNPAEVARKLLWFFPVPVDSNYAKDEIQKLIFQTQRLFYNEKSIQQDALTQIYELFDQFCGEWCFLICTVDNCLSPSDEGGQWI